MYLFCARAWNRIRSASSLLYCHKIVKFVAQYSTCYLNLVFSLISTAYHFLEWVDNVFELILIFRINPRLSSAGAFKYIIAFEKLKDFRLVFFRYRVEIGGCSFVVVLKHFNEPGFVSSDWCTFLLSSSRAFVLHLHHVLFTACSAHFCNLFFILILLKI